jgi:dodecin
MRKSKAARSAAGRAVARTGRDGGVDFALKMEAAGEGGVPADHVYRVIEIVGSSTKSIEDAIDAALERADRTLRNLRWFEVVRTSGHIAGGKAAHYQVSLKVGFTMEEVP